MSRFYIFLSSLLYVDELILLYYSMIKIYLSFDLYIGVTGLKPVMNILLLRTQLLYTQSHSTQNIVNYSKNKNLERSRY